MLDLIYIAADARVVMQTARLYVPASSFGREVSKPMYKTLGLFFVESHKAFTKNLKATSSKVNKTCIRGFQFTLGLKVLKMD